MSASVSRKDACIQEFSRLLKSGPPGMAELKRIAPTLYRFYGVDTIDEQVRVLEACELKPVASTYPVAFEPPFHYHFEDQPVPEEAKLGSRKKQRKNIPSMSVAQASTVAAPPRAAVLVNKQPLEDEKAAAGITSVASKNVDRVPEVLPPSLETLGGDGSTTDSQNPPPLEDCLLQEPPSPASIASVLPLLLPLQEETAHA